MREERNPDQGEPNDRERLDPRSVQPRRSSDCPEYERPSKELPSAGRQEVEARFGTPLHHCKVQDEAPQRHQGNRGPKPLHAQPSQDHEADRIEQVELRFEAQRPGVQQRNDLGQQPEIVDRPPQIDVRDRELSEEHLLRECFETGRKEQHPTPEHGQDERWRQSPDAVHVEHAHPERAVADDRNDDRRDEKTRDHERDIDAEKSRLGARDETKMEHAHHQDRDRAKPVEIGALPERRASRSRTARSHQSCPRPRSSDCVKSTRADP